MVLKAHHTLTEHSHMWSIMVNFFTGITGRVRGVGHTATVESKQEEEATHDEHQTLHTVMHGVQGRMLA